MLNHKQLREGLKYPLKAGVNVIIEGDTGIGKTQTVKQLAEEFTTEDINCEMVDINAGSIKEGEITGIPFKTERTQNGLNINDYTVHVKLARVMQLAEKNNTEVLLFIDEINRVHRDIQSEIMELVLERKINSVELPDNVYVIAAINPLHSDNFNYQVQKMNDAMRDRFMFLNLEVNPKGWLQWANKEVAYTNDTYTERVSKLENKISELNEKKEALHYIEENLTEYNVNDEDINNELNKIEKKIDEKKEELEIVYEDEVKTLPQVHKDIVEFIANYPQMLHTPESNEDIKASPRSWEMVSNTLREIEDDLGDYQDLDENILYEMIKGQVGSSQAMEFVKYLDNKDNPMIQVDEIMKKDGIPENIQERLTEETIPRVALLVDNVTKWMDDQDRLTAWKKERFRELLGEHIPKDTMVSAISNILDNYEDLYEKLADDEEFLDLFFETNQRIN